MFIHDVFCHAFFSYANFLWLIGNGNHVFLVSLCFTAPKCYFVELFQHPKSFSETFFSEIEVNILPRENNLQTLRIRFGSRAQVFGSSEGAQFSELDVRSTEECQQARHRALWGSLPLLQGASQRPSSHWGRPGFGSPFAHQTDNPDFIFPSKHSVFWARPMYEKMY